MRSSPPVAIRALRWLVVGLLLGYVAWLTPPFGSRVPRPDDLRDIWLCLGVLVLTTVLTLTRVVLVAENRFAWLCLTGAVACWTAGDAWYLLVVRYQDPAPSPSWADAGYLAVYPLVWFALVLLLRRMSRQLPAGVWLDGLVSGLAAAALSSALFLKPILAATGGSVETVATALAYPIADLVLLVLLVGVYAMFGWRPPAHLVLLGCGLLAFTVTDTEFLFRAATNSYVVGTTWDSGWVVGLVLVAMAAWWRPAERSRRPELKLATALLLPLLCGVLGLTILVYGCIVDLTLTSVVLSSACVLAALMRTGLAFHELQGLAQARREAATDDLTGLPNRRQLYQRLASALEDNPAPGDVAVLVIDLDRFKEVNDSLGHSAGDQLLQVVGERLVGTFRSGDLVARLGGDEFAAVVHTHGDPGSARAVAERLRRLMSEPFVIDGTTIHVGASIGIALSVEHGNDCEELLRHADIAMYHAKARGEGWRIYNSDTDSHLTDRLTVTEALRTAILSDQLVLHYQPKVELATGRVVGVEALVRWQHPERGLVYPDDFIPLAEAAGLMPALTTSVLEQALLQCSAWRAAGRDLHVAVNLSPSNLLDPALPDLVSALLDGHRLPASALHLEITEQVIMIDPKRSVDVLRRLDARGLRLSIDDYGAGYSSLTYLTTLPVSDLKIDKSFVMAMAGEGPLAERAEAVVRSTVVLAEALGLELIAEGVETAEVLAKLTAMGATMAQGYYLSRPQPAETLERWLDEQEVAELAVVG